MMLRTMEFKLKREKDLTIVCANGEEAINKIITESPDVIITDIMMPIITGLDIVRKVKAS
jgi:YesN/AraC family two-component response regulator